MSENSEPIRLDQLAEFESAPIKVHFLERDEREGQGEVGVRAYATALVGLADLVDDAAAKGVIPRGAHAKVVAEEEGSFISEVVLAWHHMPPELRTGLTLGAAAGTKRAAESLSDRFVGALDAVTGLMRGPKVVDAQPSSLDPDLVRVTRADGEFRDVTQEEWDLYNSKRSRAAVKKLFAPMGAGAGPRATELKTPRKKAELTAAEAVQIAEEGQAVDETTIDYSIKTVTPASVDFDPDQPWRVFDGKQRRIVAIEDQSFLQKVSDGQIRVGKYDSFTVLLRCERTTKVDNTTSTKWFVEQVTQYRPGGQQDELPSEPDDA